jgi:hypothetical protein
MSTTTITGTIHGVNNTALANKWITFRLVQLGTDSVSTATVAQSVDSVQTDANGDFSIDVWNNGDSGKKSILEITVDGSKAESVIIPTGTASIELWDLIENYQSDGSTSTQLPTVSELFVRKSNNLSDLGSAAVSRTNLGVAIGSNVQAHSAVLDATTASFTAAKDAEISTNTANIASNDTDIGVLTGSVVQNQTDIATNATSISNAEDAILSNIIAINDMAAGLAQSTVIVKQASDLSGVLLSNVVYFIDGIIDMGSQSIEVPAGGLSLIGSTFEVCQLTSSASGYTMFTSPVGGSGSLVGRDIAFSVNGAGSEVFDLVSSTGQEDIAFARVRWNNCSSLGTIDNYRQGFEDGSSRSGGSPSLILKGAWSGGYRISTSIVRGLSGTMTAPLFSAGAGFTMQSRFITDINCDLPTLGSLLDFSPINFPNPSTLQIRDAIVTRDGAIDATDTNITPNVAATDLCSAWSDNIGIKNTFVGGVSVISTQQAQTVISAIDIPSDLNGTWIPYNLVHFDSPGNGHLRHIGNSPREFRITFDFVLEGADGDSYEIRLIKDDGNAETQVFSQVRVINNLQGARNVAYYDATTYVELNQGDSVFWRVVNLSSAANCTLESSSQFNVESR